MPLKCAIVQQAARSGTGTQDFTDSGAGFASDVKAAIFIGCNATAADTPTGQGHFRFGVAAATGGNTQAASATISRVSGGNQDTGTTVVGTDKCYMGRTGGTSTSSLAAIDSWLTDGIRVNWTDESQEHELVTALLLGGDIEARLVSATWSSEVTKTVSHGLSGVPEVIIAFRSVASGAQFTVGFWASGGTYGYGNLYCADTANPTNVFSAANTDSCAAIMTTGTVTNRFTIAEAGPDTFECSTSSTLSSGTLYFLCLRGTTTPITAKAGAFTTKTGSTGTEAEVSGMAAAPQVLLCVPTLLTSLGTLSSDSAYGLIAACSRAGATEYGGVTLIEDDNATPADGPPYSRTTADSALVLMAVDGNEDVVATVQSWDAGGVTLNYSNIGASAFQVPYLAFGVGGLTKRVKLLAHASAASAADVEGVVLNAARDTVIGEFSGQAFEASLESGEAVLYIDTAGIVPDGDTLTVTDTPIVFAYNATQSTIGPGSATVIEE